MSPSRKKWVGVLVIAFGVFHAASLLLALLPREWGINRAIEPYRRVTGTPQHWRMFHTIPRVQDREMTVTVTDGGKVYTMGPILPGAKEFTSGKRIRYYQLLDRLTSPENPYLGDYVKSISRELAGRGVFESTAEFPVSLSFELNIETDYIRLPKLIEEDGMMILRKSDSLGPFMISKE